MKKLSRRQFMKILSAGFLSGIFLELFSRTGISGVFAAKSNARPKSNIKGLHDLVVAKGNDPALITRKAVEGLGGMEKFVKKDATVVIKPNIAWDRSPEQAANTNPQVVAALVQMCYEAGAKRVNVFDIPCNSPERCYENSGIRKAALEKGAKVYFCDSWNFVKAAFSYNSPMEGWPVFRDAIECDTFINVPVLKHHGLTELTLSMKNMMGVCGGNRGLIHLDIAKKLVDITDFISPDLTVIDAYRILTRHGPSGGDLNDVLLAKTVIAGTDPTLIDAYAAKFAGKDPMNISYIREAAQRNFGSADISAADILELRV